MSARPIKIHYPLWLSFSLRLYTLIVFILFVFFSVYPIILSRGLLGPIKMKIKKWFKWMTNGMRGMTPTQPWALSRHWGAYFSNSLKTKERNWRKKKRKTNEEEIEGQEVDWRREEDHLKETHSSDWRKIRRRSQKIFWSEDYDE